MADPALAAPASGRSLSVGTTRFTATFAAMLVATVLFLFFDFFLAGVDRRESGAHAEAEYAAGLALLAAGHAEDAAARLGAAVAIDRQNVRYSLSFGEALLAQGRTTDAEATLRALLDQAENDGAVNLAMAHVMLRENRPADATAYFHRAIFGRWGADSTARRTAARFELIDLLARTGAARELLAELLPLEELSPDSLALEHRLGHLFILAGSPARAATIFRGLLRRDSRDADAYTGMGEAELALGNFRTAHEDLARAHDLQPDDRGIAGDLAMADSVLALDPSATDIGARERYLRSRALLSRTIAALGACPAAAPPPPSDSAGALLAMTPAPSREDQVGHAMVSVAGDLWATEAGTCAMAARDTILRFLHGHLAM